MVEARVGTTVAEAAVVMGAGPLLLWCPGHLKCHGCSGWGVAAEVVGAAAVEEFPKQPPRSFFMNKIFLFKAATLNKCLTSHTAQLSLLRASPSSPVSLVMT